ncbi:hypothetical protein [Streptomyces cucumeris]|uniref:hypothetical protein n=1 Tax=Streptomyces cucumeris TaxID=2962890 RepID=UPI003D755FA9
MAFNSEWTELMSAARAQQSASMRLNQAISGPGSTSTAGKADLVVTQDDLGAVGHEAFRLHEQLRKKADIASAGSEKTESGSTARAAKEFSTHQLTMGNELLNTLSVWGLQVKTVLQMCAHISNHLDYSRKQHERDDKRIAASLQHRDGTAVSVSEISKYVK